MEDNNNRRTEFLIEAYKTRIQFFSEHASRTWARFNLLLTVELAYSERPKGAQRLKGVEESPCRGHSRHCRRRFLDSLRSLGMTHHGEPE